MFRLVVHCDVNGFSEGSHAHSLNSRWQIEVQLQRRQKTYPSGLIVSRLITVESLRSRFNLLLLLNVSSTASDLVMAKVEVLGKFLCAVWVEGFGRGFLSQGSGPTNHWLNHSWARKLVRVT